jgi:hypothetical protein
LDHRFGEGLDPSAHPIGGEVKVLSQTEFRATESLWIA